MIFRLFRKSLDTSLRLIQRPILWTSSSNFSFSPARNYLTENYQAFEKWDQSLSTEILQKTNISELLIDVEDKLNRKKYVSSLDIEIMAARLTHVETTEDLKLAETILEKFRTTNEALDFQPSLAYSLVRNYLDLGQKDRILPLLRDKVKYGIFLDRFSANLLLDAFLVEKKYKDAAQISVDLMLQDDNEDRLTHALALSACYNFFLTATDADFQNETQEEEDEDIVKVKIEFVRNLINDDHFDLTDRRQLLGKALAYFVRETNSSELLSLKILGYTLYKKYGRVCDSLEQILSDERLQLDKTTADFLIKELDSFVYKEEDSKYRLPQSAYRPLEIIPEAARDLIKEKLLPKLTEKKKIVELDLKSFVEKNLVETGAVLDRDETLKHEKQIEIWSRERQEQFDDQIRRFLIEQKKSDLIERLRLIEERDELLSFFENESRILMFSQDRDFLDESFENVRAPGEHEFFELSRKHYHWDRMEPKRSLHMDKKMRDEEMSDLRTWPPYKYLAENWKYDLVDYVPLPEKSKRRKEDLPPTGKPPFYKQHFF